MSSSTSETPWIGRLVKKLFIIALLAACTWLVFVLTTIVITIGAEFSREQLTYRVIVYTIGSVAAATILVLGLSDKELGL